MERQASLADLLKIVVGVDESAPVSATSGIAFWHGRDAQAWPPADGAGGLWLIDTRDRPDLRTLIDASFDAALVLSGSGPPGSPLRRLARRLRRRVRPRQSEASVAGVLGARAGRMRRLAFDDGGDVPIGFDHRAASTGAAFLLTAREPFTGPAWSLATERLGSVPDVLGFQLRARGAAVIIVQAAGGRFVLRFVPAGPLQDVVLRNHSSLLDLRRRLAGYDELLRLIPEPVFAEYAGSVAVLAETCLPGTLAWQVVLANPAHAAAIRRHAHWYLDRLRTATVRHVSGRDTLMSMLRDDAERVNNATFADARVRNVIRSELDRAADVLSAGFDAYTSHGDYGYGNILVDPKSGDLEGVIDWDTSRDRDFPGIDRVNLEIQILRTVQRQSFPDAVRTVWQEGLATDALRGAGGAARVRALFGLAVSRYVTRAMGYPELYRYSAGEFDRALTWLSQTGPAAT